MSTVYRLTDIGLGIFLFPKFRFHEDMDIHEHFLEEDAQRVIISEDTESRRKCGLGTTQISRMDEILNGLSPSKTPCPIMFL